MAEDAQLVRVISRWEIVALSVNDVVGSSIYVILPVATAALLGPASIWAIVAAGLAVVMLVLCFAEAASHFDKAGAAYLYTRTAFGDFVGFEVAWMTWIAKLSTVSSLAAFVPRVVGYLIPAANTGAGTLITSLVSIVLLTTLNLTGVKEGARAAVILTWGKLLPLALFVIVGFFFVKWDRVLPMPMPSGANFNKAALLLLFAYAGFENIAAPAGEFKNPRRDIPFALIVMITSVTAIYALVQLVAIGTIADLNASKTPLADSMRTMIGPVGGLILTIGAILSVLGTMNNTILAGPRYLYALAERGVLPAVLKKVHPRFHTPHVAILTQSTIAAFLVLLGGAETIAELSIIARLATYVGTAAAVPILRRKMPPREGGLRLPGGPIIPILALGICLVFLSSATTRNLVAGGIVLTIGAIIFISRKSQLAAEAPAE